MVFRYALRVLRITLCLCLIAYTALVIHDFYRYVDHSIYMAVDDGEAAIAYSLATEGRYGFLSSPILVGLPRNHGQFNYGPWYFALAAGLIWLFGYSLTLVRSIHLGLILFSIVAAAVWFRGRDRPIAAGIFGLGVLYCFEVEQWPMARPDSLVSAFAVTCILCSGVAISKSRSGWWFWAGLAAACGALTHLIAWSLIPSSILLFVIAGWGQFRRNENRGEAWSGVRHGAWALTGGIGLGAAMFYASFGFRIRDQLSFLASYRELTASHSTYTEVLLKHLHTAFPTPLLQTVVWVLLALGWLIVAAAPRLNAIVLRTSRAYLLPPLVIWSDYLLSNGWYTNYHLGYGILHQLMAVWTATAIVWIFLQFLRDRAARLEGVVTVFIMVALVILGVRQMEWQLAAGTGKLQRAEKWVSISDYMNEILRILPARATAWGSVIYGIESPARVQLVQLSDATTLFSKVPPEQRAALVPEFMIWGYPENRDNFISVLRGGDSLWSGVTRLLPGIEYHLVSLTAAPPYGTTRVFARADSGSVGLSAIPRISVYDAEHRSWLHRLKPVTNRFEPRQPATLRIGYAANPSPSLATRSMAADLPPGYYLLRIGLQAGSGDSGRRLVGAVPSTMLTQTISELGPQGDFAGYTRDDAEAFLLVSHPGGALVVSQFDEDEGADIRSIDLFSVLGLRDPVETPFHSYSLPALDEWKAVKGVHITTTADGRLQVDGDGTQFGYQVMSPRIPASQGDRIMVRIAMRLDSGAVCPGALNGTDQTWLLAPERPDDEFNFTVDSTKGFRVVFANCNANTSGVNSRFFVSPGTYLKETDELYADRLVAAALRGSQANPHGPGNRSIRSHGH